MADTTNISSSVVDPFPAVIALPNATVEAPLIKCCSLATPPNLPVTKLGAAVVDLSDCAYAGNNDDDMLYVGSLAKIYSVYAAFWLRSRVEVQAKTMIAAGLSTVQTGWEEKVYAELRKSWRSKLYAAFPGLPSGMPEFSTILTLSKTGEASFTEADPPLSDKELDEIGENNTPKGKYRDWMKVMLRWSNNLAASYCIRPLSYPYINGVLASAGFFDKANRNGLWLAGDYNGNDWLHGTNNPAGQPLTARWAALQRRTRSNETGTARQIARFMTSLATGKLVDQSSCADIISMATGAYKIGSYIAAGLSSSSRPFTIVTSKIGLGEDAFSHDCAIVRVDHPRGTGGAFNLVEVILGSPPSQNRADLYQLATSYYDCIAARHP